MQRAVRLPSLGTDTFTVFIQGFINESLPISFRMLSVLAGCLILSLGISIVINSNAGTGPNDLVAIVLSDKLPNIEFRWVRIGCDSFFVVLGWFLGGTVGIGTIVAVCLTGPLVQFWLPKTESICRSLIGDKDHT